MPKGMGGLCAGGEVGVAAAAAGAGADAEGAGVADAAAGGVAVEEEEGVEVGAGAEVEEGTVNVLADAAGVAVEKEPWSPFGTSRSGGTMLDLAETGAAGACFLGDRTEPPLDTVPISGWVGGIESAAVFEVLAAVAGAAVVVVLVAAAAATAAAAVAVGATSPMAALVSALIQSCISESESATKK